MENRRTTITLALIVLICFFLPWVQVSCGSSSSRLTGVDLARDSHHSLWLIPLLMLVILLVAAGRAWKKPDSAFVLFLGGLGAPALLNTGSMSAAENYSPVAGLHAAWVYVGDLV